MARKPALSSVSASSGEIVEGVSRTTVVYDLLKYDLLHGVFPAGEKLATAALSTHYNIGVSSVREALSRLSAEGLVERIDQRGFRVAGMDWSELPILTQTRCMVEGMALRESIQRRNEVWENQLVLINHRLTKTPRSLAVDGYVRNPVWEDLHAQFHRCLLANCPSRWLRQFCESLADEAYRFRQVAASRHYSKREELREHVPLFSACIEGREDDAVALLVAHYQRTAQLTQAAIGLVPTQD